MPLEATVISVKTRPYTDQEMKELPHDEHEKVKHFCLEKPIALETIAHFTTEDLDEIRRRVVEIATRLNPEPVVVITDTFPDSFLVGKQCHRKSPDPIFEQILFRLDPDHPSHSDMKTHGEAQSPKPESDAAESVPKTDPMVPGEDDASAKFMVLQAESLGFSSHDEFLNYMMENVRQAVNPGIDYNKAIKKFKEDFSKRYYEHGGRGAYATLENPKETLKNTTIQFRVICRKEDMRFSECCRNFSRLRGIRLSCAITNEIADSTVSFKHK